MPPAPSTPHRQILVPRHFNEVPSLREEPAQYCVATEVHRYLQLASVRPPNLTDC